MYTDYGLFTCDPVITRDVVNLFHHLTGYSTEPQFERLLVAPLNMRERFIALIEREIEHHRAGRPARIVAKLNQLEDLPVCEALCEASQAGVPVDLVIRGFCCLRPGIPGWTENLRVRSIVGRFLEHGRLFHFANGEANPLDGEFYIGSADWMDRNLSRRVEAVTPVKVRSLRERLWEDLVVQLEDRRNAWQMQPDGSYVQLHAEPGASEVAREGTHVTHMKRTRARLRR
jgi:polyphosphate kinase